MVSASWIAQADVDDGTKTGLTTDERAELATAIFEWIKPFYTPPDVTPPWTTSAFW